MSLASAGGLRPPVRNVLDSEGCQSYQCPSLGTWCIRVPPRWRERFGSKLHAARVFKFSGVEGIVPDDLLDVLVFLGWECESGPLSAITSERRTYDRL